MKRSTFITIISLLIPLLGMSQTRDPYNDDIYLKPGNFKTHVSTQPQNQKQSIPKYKNGAKEIIYLERENLNTQVTHDTVYVVGTANEKRKNIISTNNSAHDTVFVVGEANDNTENNQEQGYYLNGFKGTESDMDYAERIRRFHNPRYEINIADPRYNDIYFLNDYDWNVYIDGMYAYVTPTWTNPAWWNYTYSPYNYGNWGFGFNNFYSPFSAYGNSFDYPWGFDNFYGGFGYYGLGGYFGYGGYYGYGYPYYGYGEGYWGYGYGSGGNWNTGKHHEDADLRLRNGISSRESGFGYNTTKTAASSRVTSNQYTAISGSKGINNTRSSSRSVSNGIGVIRNGYTNRTNGLNISSYTTSSRSEILNINTRPRITNYNSNNLNNYSSRSVNSNSTSIRSMNSSRSNYSSGNNSTYYPSSNNSGSSRSSSSSYSGSSSSGSSTSGGGSSSGSRSSGGGGGRR